MYVHVYLDLYLDLDAIWSSYIYPCNITLGKRLLVVQYYIVKLYSVEGHSFLFTIMARHHQYHKQNVVAEGSECSVRHGLSWIRTE